MRAKDLTPATTHIRQGRRAHQTGGGSRRHGNRESLSLHCEAPTYFHRSTLPMISGRPKWTRGQMSQVIHNLVVNADQAMPAGGELCVSVENTPVPASSALPLLPAQLHSDLCKRRGHRHRTGASAAHLRSIFHHQAIRELVGPRHCLLHCHSAWRTHRCRIRTGGLEPPSPSTCRPAPRSLILPGSRARRSRQQAGSTGKNPIDG